MIRRLRARLRRRKRPPMSFAELQAEDDRQWRQRLRQAGQRRS